MLDVLDFLGVIVIWRMLFSRKKRGYFSCPHCDKKIEEIKSINLIDGKKHGFECPHCEHVLLLEKTLTPASQTSAQSFTEEKKTTQSEQGGKGKSFITLTVRSLQK
ncbi:MAG: hypothetical protein NTZ95_03390 [Candidatus Omnitrophica bacterium]|nr:hypothetical protein [Candidatus Omnitrophota bacterium]